MKEMSKRIKSNVSEKIRNLAPDFVRYGEEILFDEVWRKPELSLKERSLITLSSLISLGNSEQLLFHLELAKKNGITEQEIVALITHIAFYAGWPKASTALNILLNSLCEGTGKMGHSSVDVTAQGI
jgi:4-carboxymuconolactone decarboxylase